MGYFLGIEVHRPSMGSKAVQLTQTKYVKDLLAKARMVDAKPIPTPMLTNQKLSAHGDTSCVDPSLYRSIVGGLQYATITRPDLSFAVNKVIQFMHNPLEVHWKAVKRILRYLAGILNHGLVFHPCKELRLIAFCDSDWGSDVDDRKSTSGYCIFLGPNVISWSSKKQAVVSRSSTEAEFRSLAATIADLYWIKSLLQELRVPCSTAPTIFCDNLSAVLMSANPILHQGSKNFELDLHFVRDKVIQKQVFVSHLPSTEQVVDVLTKSISAAPFLKFRDKLRVLPSLMSLRGDDRQGVCNKIESVSDGT